jgi:hypothetical protein
MLLHRALDGTGPQPFEDYVGRLSEEFGGALPSVILAERAQLPAGFLEQLIEYRAYRPAYRALKAADSAEARDRLRQWDLGALAEQIEMELAEEEVAEQRGR